MNKVDNYVASHDDDPSMYRTAGWKSVAKYQSVAGRHEALPGFIIEIDVSRALKEKIVLLNKFAAVDSIFE
jgi:hypothetical protein